MNLPLQMGAVFRGRLSVSSMSRSNVPGGRVLPSTNPCNVNSSLPANQLNKPCKCASDAKEYRCVGPNDDCLACTP
jgi:hypothetical protein